ELARVERLERTLELTRTFLLRAQDQVHRSVAPRLAEQVSEWLPQVTGGRYVKALVDPATLAVGVRGEDGPWREAALLSHGTAGREHVDPGGRGRQRDAVHGAATGAAHRPGARERRGAAGPERLAPAPGGLVHAARHVPARSRQSERNVHRRSADRVRSGGDP